MGACVSLTLFACLWDSFPPVRMLCPVSVWGISSCLIVSFFLVYGCFLLEFCIFSEGKWRGSGLREEGRWWRKLGGMEGEETSLDILH